MAPGHRANLHRWVLVPPCGVAHVGPTGSVDGLPGAVSTPLAAGRMYTVPLSKHMFESTSIFEHDLQRPSCHCATLAELPNGELLAAWYAGTYETAPDVALLAARWHRVTQRWSAPEVVVDTPGKSDGQPVFLVHPDRSLWLFYVTIEQTDWTSAHMKYRISHDWGQTWGDEQRLPTEPGWMFRSKPLILDTGEIVLPIYDEKTWHSFMMRSADGGTTWQFGDMIHTAQGNIHPCVVPLSDGRLLAYLRTGGSGGWIWRATSSDGGYTWSAAEQTALPNPNAGIDLIRLRNGHLVLAFNNTAKARTPLNVALSEDEGWTWTYLQTIASGPQTDSLHFMALREYWGGEGHATETRPMEYSYPTLLQARDGLIHLVYTDNRVTIRHVIFDEAWLRTGQQWEQRT